MSVFLVDIVLFSEKMEVITWNNSKLFTVLYNTSNNENVLRVMDLELIIPEVGTDLFFF